MDPMPKEITSRVSATHLLVLAVVGVGLSVSSLYSYLLFHTLVEVFSILVACLIFVLAWHTRTVHDNAYLLFIGIASLFTAFLELAHALTYTGMTIFPGYDANLPTQLWISFRYRFSLSFVVAPFFVSRKLKTERIFGIYRAVTALLFFALFSGRFPLGGLPPASASDW